MALRLVLLLLLSLLLEQNIRAWAVAGAVLSSPLGPRVQQARGALYASTADEALATTFAARDAWERADAEGDQARSSTLFTDGL